MDFSLIYVRILNHIQTVAFNIRANRTEWTIHVGQSEREGPNGFAVIFIVLGYSIRFNSAGKMGACVYAHKCGHWLHGYSALEGSRAEESAVFELVNSVQKICFCQMNWRASSAPRLFCCSTLGRMLEFMNAFIRLRYECAQIWSNGNFLQLYDVMCDGSGYHVVSCRESMFIYIVSVGQICRTFGLHCALALSASTPPPSSPFLPCETANDWHPKNVQHACERDFMDFGISLTQLLHIFHRPSAHHRFVSRTYATSTLNTFIQCTNSYNNK